MSEGLANGPYTVSSLRLEHLLSLVQAERSNISDTVSHISLVSNVYQLKVHLRGFYGEGLNKYSKESAKAIAWLRTI